MLTSPGSYGPVVFKGGTARTKCTWWPEDRPSAQETSVEHEHGDEDEHQHDDFVRGALLRS